MRTAGLATVAVLAGVGLLSTAAPSCAAVTLNATAGLGGAGRAGRWAPVHVVLDNAGAQLAGEVEVQWGEARTRRPVVLAAPSRNEFEMYIRTAEPRESLTVRVVVDGAEVARQSVILRLVAPDETVALCVTDDGNAVEVPPGADGAPIVCAGALQPSRLPTSIRGYDAADLVVWRAGPERGLSVAQREALSRWRGYQALNTAGALAVAPRVPAPVPGPAGSARVVTLLGGGLALYIVLLAVAASAVRGRSAPVSYAVMALVIGMASAVAAVAGSRGPASSIRVRHALSLLQLPGGGALLTGQALLEFPSLDTYRTRARLGDGVMQMAGTGDADVALDGEGFPTVGGRLALGDTRTVVLEGTVDGAWLALVRNGATVRATNVSTTALEDCRFPPGFEPQSAGTLAPGQSFDAVEQLADDPQFVTCRLPRTPVAFDDASRTVEDDGTTVVSAYVPPPAGAEGGQP